MSDTPLHEAISASYVQCEMGSCTFHSKAAVAASACVCVCVTDVHLTRVEYYDSTVEILITVEIFSSNIRILFVLCICEHVAEGVRPPTPSAHREGGHFTFCITALLCPLCKNP